jgi:hypothetical protein
MSDDNRSRDPKNWCCDTMRAATVEGTDNESWGALIYRPDEHNPHWVTGSSLPPIKFCPWCGHKLEGIEQ